jgi:hypothetical protein
MSTSACVSRLSRRGFLRATITAHEASPRGTDYTKEQV